MYSSIFKAKHVEGYKIAVTFENGKKGIVDFKDYAKLGGIFSRFADMEYFKKFHINEEVGVLCWPDELDIAPEILYHEATGEPLPEWMKADDGRKEAI